MCGIYGFTRASDDDQFAQLTLAKMGALLRHRGPDGDGTYVDAGVALGHRRLSIIDLEGGRQPMEDWLGKHVITYNGEIYNFPELRARYQNAGFRFRTNSDTEVLLAAWAAEGRECVKRLQGMFAFAIWNRESRELFLARDRVGKKPLYYCQADGRFIFASELKAILALPHVKRDLDYEALNFYLTHGYIPAPHTIFRSIRKVRAGHFLTWTGLQPREQMYWDLPTQPGTATESDDESLANLEKLLKDAVRSRLISDVPIGAFLSGGIDSSIVVAMMAQVSPERVKTFTINFDDQEFSESDDARVIAERFDTAHHELDVTTDAVAVLPEIVRHFDEPFADSSAIPTFYVSRLAREHVTVILSGDGGDELFAGYRSYQKASEYRHLLKLPAGLRQMTFGRLAAALPMQAPMRNLLKFLGTAVPDDGPGALGLYPYIKEDIVSRDVLVHLRPYDTRGLRDAVLSRYALHTKLEKLQYADTKLYLPGDILAKVDRMSMAHSLETRAPLLDYRVVEFAASLPVSMKVRDGVSKYPLKRVLAQYVPEEIINKKKQGFAVPLGKWFRNELASYTHDVLLGQACKQRGFFEPQVVEQLLKHHATGARDYSEWIWMLLMFELWAQAYLDQSPADAIQVLPDKQESC